MDAGHVGARHPPLGRTPRRTREQRRRTQASARNMKWLRALALLIFLPALLHAQNTNSELRESQARLAKIREEKAGLERELDALKSRVRDATREKSNVAKQ